MTEKLSINLTEGDIEVWLDKASSIVKYEATCPMCNMQFALSRIGKTVCDCDIEWSVEVKIKGTRTLDDDDKAQIPLPMSSKDATDTS